MDKGDCSLFNDFDSVIKTMKFKFPQQVAKTNIYSILMLEECKIKSAEMAQLLSA